MGKQLDFKEKLLRFAKKTKKKTDKHVWLAILVLTVFIYGSGWVNKPSEAKMIEQTDDILVTATMVGDMMFGRHVEEVKNRYSQEHLFRYVKPYFENADYSTGNFEHPVVHSDEYEKQEKFIHLQTDAKSVETLKKMNFSVLNLANNHAMDYLENGLNDSITTFNQYDLSFVGAGKNLEEASNIIYKQVNGINIATLGFTDAYVPKSGATEKKPGVLKVKPEIFIPLIEEAKEKADLVVVHVHWGQEYDTEASPRQKGLAKAIADSGADIIIGHHPHVLQPVEIYNDTIIFYSLGNFIFDQGWSTARETALVQYHLNKNGVAQFEITPLLIKEATPTPLGSLDGYYKRKIFNRLTKDSSILFSEEDNKLTFSVNHSHVLNKEPAK
ncbi:CapA family protein [Bacillus sp. FJAT-50079]|uniref:CapA family protein n=1 Tax=Bacillus sp. FJAT-50079 TaxID=2833577 RepID=UPI001BC9E404|nr:CapA family protein [Bacillus sp. FJAT-50079]MBS4206728.1 CapA family protein [Bacillus sp. FJAT-50079]